MQTKAASPKSRLPAYNEFLFCPFFIAAIFFLLRGFSEGFIFRVFVRSDFHFELHEKRSFSARTKNKIRTKTKFSAEPKLEKFCAFRRRQNLRFCTCQKTFSFLCIFSIRKPLFTNSKSSRYERFYCLLFRFFCFADFLSAELFLQDFLKY